MPKAPPQRSRLAPVDDDPSDYLPSEGTEARNEVLGNLAGTLSDDELGFYSLDEADDFINALYYGREGTGKTTNVAFMANLPGATRILIVNAEAGTKKVALRRRGIDVSKIVMWPPPGVEVTIERLEALHLRLLSDLADDPTSWTGVAWDSISEIATLMRERITDTRYARLESLNREFDDTEIEGNDYTTLNNQIRKIVRRFRDLPCHFAATALEREDDKTGQIGPEATPGVAKAIMAACDYVLYCRADQQIAGEYETDTGSEFRALTRATTKYRAKDRFDVLPRALADPTFLRIHGYVTGDLEEESDALQRAYVERREQRRAAAEEAEQAKAAKKAEARKRTATRS